MKNTKITYLLFLCLYSINGRVGIFNNTPSVALEIGTSGSSQQVKVNGNIVIGSDERMKENIQDIDHTASRLMQLRSVSYTLKGASNNKVQLQKEIAINEVGGIEKPEFIPQPNPQLASRTFYGFLAQDVQKQFPDLVYEDDKTGMLSVDYIGLIPVMLDALRDQQAQIEELKTGVSPVKLRSESSTNETASIDMTNETIAGCQLFQNTPNPFTVNTEIKYYLPAEIVKANLYVYDMQGKQIKNIPVAERGKGTIQI